jgi:uncharacterized protein YpmS
MEGQKKEINEGRILIGTDSIQHMLILPKIDVMDKNVVINFSSSTTPLRIDIPKEVVVKIIESFNDIPYFFSFHSKTGILHFLNMKHIDYVVEMITSKPETSKMVVFFSNDSDIQQEMSTIDAGRLMKTFEHNNKFIGINLTNLSISGNSPGLI